MGKKELIFNFGSVKNYKKYISKMREDSSISYRFYSMEFQKLIFWWDSSSPLFY